MVELPRHMSLGTAAPQLLALNHIDTVNAGSSESNLAAMALLVFAPPSSLPLLSMAI